MIVRFAIGIYTFASIIMGNTNSKIQKVYYDKSDSNVYGSIAKIHAALKNKKVSHSKIKKWLKSQDVYTLHYPIRKKKFHRNHYIVQDIDQLWEIDLCDMKMYKKFNDNYTFLLSVIDVFSKYGWVYPLRNKTGKEITKVFHKILHDSNRKPITVQSDKGKEFKNSNFQNYLKHNNIRQRFPQILSTQKAAVVERFNRTIKEKMFKYFTANSTKRYIDILPNLIKSYNNSYHSTIKMKPSDVNHSHVKQIYKIYKNLPKKDPRINLDLFEGDYVRIVRKKSTFEPGYTEKWTKEIFQVHKIINREPYPLFILKDSQDREVEGRFYYQELQKINKK